MSALDDAVARLKVFNRQRRGYVDARNTIDAEALSLQDMIDNLDIEIIKIRRAVMAMIEDDQP